MPSFDIVSEFDQHELDNAVDQANREVANRFDFKDSGAKFDLTQNLIKMSAENDFQLQQMLDILYKKMTKRGVDVAHIEPKTPVLQHKKAEQELVLKQGIAADIAKKIIKLIKDQKMKVQASIQGEQVRVTGKKRDDLQAVIAFFRGETEIKLPLDFVNFRD